MRAGSGVSLAVEIGRACRRPASPALGVVPPRASTSSIPCRPLGSLRPWPRCVPDRLRCSCPLHDAPRTDPGKDAVAQAARARSPCRHGSRPVRVRPRETGAATMSHPPRTSRGVGVYVENAYNAMLLGCGLLRQTPRDKTGAAPESPQRSETAFCRERHAVPLLLDADDRIRAGRIRTTGHTTGPAPRRGPRGARRLRTRRAAPGEGTMGPRRAPLRRACRGSSPSGCPCSRSASCAPRAHCARRGTR